MEPSLQFQQLPHFPIDLNLINIFPRQHLPDLPTYDLNLFLEIHQQGVVALWFLLLLLGQFDGVFGDGLFLLVGGGRVVLLLLLHFDFGYIMMGNLYYWCVGGCYYYIKENLAITDQLIFGNAIFGLEFGPHSLV